MKKLLNKIRNINWTYLSKTMSWTVFMFVVMLAPLASPWQLMYSGSAFGTIGIAFGIYLPIFLSIYLFIYWRETKRIKDLEWPTIGLFIGIALLLAFFVGLFTYAIGFQHYGYSNQPTGDQIAFMAGNLSWPMMFVLYLLVFGIIAVAFAYSLQLLFLATIKHSNEIAGKETSIRMMFKAGIRGWTTTNWANNTILITKNNIYVVKHVFEKDKVSTLTFEHKQLIKENENTVRELTLNEEEQFYKTINDDALVLNTKYVAKTLSEKFKLTVTPVFLFDTEEMPAIYGHIGSVVVTSREGLIDSIKNFDKTSSITIKKHSYILNELKK